MYMRDGKDRCRPIEMHLVPMLYVAGCRLYTWQGIPLHTLHNNTMNTHVVLGITGAPYRPMPA